MTVNIVENKESLELIDESEFCCDPVYFRLGVAKNSKMYLRSGALTKLRHAQNKIIKYGYRLKIFDAFRPIYVQEFMFNRAFQEIKNKNPNFDQQNIYKETCKFWSPPTIDESAPPPHNTGGTVDLTIVDSNGDELPMGSEFDELSERSAFDYFINEGKHDKDAKKFQINRELLKKTMESGDFIAYPLEWWHFSFGNQEWAKARPNQTALYGSAERQFRAIA